MTGSTSFQARTTTTATGVPPIRPHTVHPCAGDFSTNLHSSSKTPSVSQHQGTLNTIFNPQSLVPCEPETFNLIPDSFNWIPKTFNLIHENVNSIPNTESGSAFYLDENSFSSQIYHSSPQKPGLPRTWIPHSRLQPLNQPLQYFRHLETRNYNPCS